LSDIIEPLLKKIGQIDNKENERENHFTTSLLYIIQFHLQEQESIHQFHYCHIIMKNNRYTLSQTSEYEGPTNVREMKQRTKNRKKDYQQIKAERTARIQSIQKNWEINRGITPSHQEDEIQQDVRFCGCCFW